jgi:hypothetical protein
MNSARKQKKRSPLKQKPLRNPGESLHEETQRFIDDRLLPPLIMAVFAVSFAAYEWWRWLTSTPPRPVIVTLTAALIVAYAAYKTVHLRPRLKSMRLGLEGEKAVGQSLEALRSQGCRVFHDILAEGFNIDHVVIGPKGVFAIETKTFSKPARGETVAKYDGDKILFNGLKPDRNPVTQARAVRSWVSDFLFKTTARRWPVRGVVILPGWFVERLPEAKRSDVWVLNEKALPSFVEHEPVVLKKEDIALASSRLEDHITG